MPQVVVCAMAHSPNSRPDPSDPNKFRSVSTAEADLGLCLAEWQHALSAHGAGPLSADLALDLVLNNIVELARESTHAGAAAIALTRDGEIICRAASGESAPDLGTRLSSETGLSAACVQTGNWQRCDDSESDPRVDAGLCRRLGVRSMLVVPVLKEGTVLGVLEVFSPQAQVFGDAELETLRMLSRSIVENVDLARRLPANAAGLPAGEEPKPSQDNRTAAVEKRLAAPINPEAQTADFWTGALMMAVVALALTLGWMIGRAGRQREAVSARGNGNGRQAQSLQSQVPEPTAQGHAAAAGPAGSGSELVVYQNGRLVFPQAPEPARPREVVASGEAVRPAAGRSEIPTDRPVRLSPDVSAQLLTQRIEPDYPPSARERRVQGAVDLDALVSKTGVVEKFTAIRGDPDLAAAASAAVRQWRFKPYQRDGQAEAFQTRITVVFRLP